MKVDLSLLEQQPLVFDERIELAPERLDASQVAGPVTVRLQGTVCAAAGCFVLEGSVSMFGPLICVRCLAPVPWQLEDRLSIEYRPPRPGSAADEEFELEQGELEVAFLDGEVLDLDEVAAEQVMLALPMRIVCDEQCAGLCPRCGANRNVAGACRCEPEIDPRWQALRGLAGRDVN